MEKEKFHHTWNGLFIEQMFSKGITRVDAENFELYFSDSSGEIKRVDSIGFVTDVEGNHTGIVFKNDPLKEGAGVGEIEISNECKPSVEKKEDKSEKPAEKRVKNGKSTVGKSVKRTRSVKKVAGSKE